MGWLVALKRFEYCFSCFDVVLCFKLHSMPSSYSSANDIQCGIEYALPLSHVKFQLCFVGTKAYHNHCRILNSTMWRVLLWCTEFENTLVCP